MSQESKESTAVVLGGGGLAGIGWTIGVLAALEEAGALRLAAADHVIGTSAGAAVAAAVLQAGAGAEYDRVVRKARRNTELAPAVSLADILPDVLAVHGADASLAEKAGRLAVLSRERSGTDPALRREAIAGRLQKDAWPDARLSVTAVRADGEPVVFTADSGVSLVDALTASCAVPGLWPVATIDGADYVDGGTFSLTNAELAAHADRVLVLRPQPELPVYVTPERQQVLDRAVVIEPSERARAGFGSDPFDPDVRGVAAVLGYEDGLAAVSAVASLTGK
ncbi:patatin-like phospholipase family protein [Streptacidiphilus fuscans]|uniref:Patatin-like phospholipase family protein n=1 Tax=Streptacidiphilus fuscans TaxID=2789292 RepID=A0A931B2J9_9ACTN|nr:patatin-like phospholipase family protein [Streptacidiphilus fuscans]MBF9067512.1 patatin-like phospholipase family protein [Streptacidiphilus fuscans]